MPEYRRFVAYVYEYRKGRKEENCGFIRVEARDTQCRIEGNIRCPGLPADIPYEVQGIVRTPNGVRGAKIGTGRTFQDGIQCLLTCETDNLDQEGTSLSELGGLLLITEGGAFFGTEWDDVPIIPADFMYSRKIEEEQITPEPTAPLQPESESLQSAALLEDSAPEEPERNERETEKNEMIMEENPEINSEIEEPEEIKEEETPPLEIEERNATEPLNPTLIESDELPVPDTWQEQPETPVEEAPPSDFPHYEPEQERKIVSPNLPGEPFDPFGDGEIIDCHRIHPQDLRYLSQRDRTLRNNRFLSHGYYNFGHLLLGKTAQNQYVIGIPGGYDQQERFMANMHGFPYFKESPQIRLRQAKGGYWYRLINAPNFHNRNRS